MRTSDPVRGEESRSTGGWAKTADGVAASVHDDIMGVIMNSTACPIYHQVSEDLGIFPLHMASSFHTHEKFMRDHRQSEWLEQATTRAFFGPAPIRRGKARRRLRKS